MSKKKKITIVVVTVFILIAAVAGAFALIMQKQTDQFNDVMAEVSQINELTNQEYTANIDREKLNELLERRVSGGKYGQVEDAFKNYMTDLYAIVYDATDAAGDEAFSTFLSPNNIEQDGPAFDNSRKTAEELITRLETDKEKYTEMVTANAVDSYSQRAGLEGKYKEMYDTILSAHKTSGEDPDQFVSSIDSNLSDLAVLNDIFDFLGENKDNWYLEDGKIIFRTEELYNNYADLTGKLS